MPVHSQKVPGTDNMTFREKWFQEALRSAMKVTSKDASSGNDHPAIAAKVGVCWCGCVGVGVVPSRVYGCVHRVAF